MNYVEIVCKYCKQAGLVFDVGERGIAVYNNKYLLFSSGGINRTEEEMAESVLIRMMDFGIKKAIEEWDKVKNGKGEINLTIDNIPEPQFDKSLNK